MTSTQKYGLRWQSRKKQSHHYSSLGVGDEPVDGGEVLPLRQLLVQTPENLGECKGKKRNARMRRHHAEGGHRRKLQRTSRTELTATATETIQQGSNRFALHEQVSGEEGQKLTSTDSERSRFQVASQIARVALTLYPQNQRRHPFFTLPPSRKTFKIAALFIKHKRSFFPAALYVIKQKHKAINSNRTHGESASLQVCSSLSACNQYGLVAPTKSTNATSGGKTKIRFHIPQKSAHANPRGFCPEKRKRKLSQQYST